MPKKLTYEVIKKEIEKENYILLSKEYVNNRTPLEMICDCGHHIYMRYDNFKAKKRCKFCANNVKLTQEEVKEIIEKENYKLLSEYISMHKPIIIQCDKGHIYKTSLNSFKDNNCRCPICSKSKGEEKIANYLNNNNINFIQQYTFDDCMFEHRLLFDFHLPQYNICIEYDGIQHYEPIDFGNKGEEWALKQFEKNKIKDNIKTEFCQQNNIKLIRIPYWDFDNIEEILTREFINKHE